MEKKRKPGPKVTVGTDVIHYRIRFQCKDMRKITVAATRRGLGTQEFMRLACNLVADKVLTQTPEEALGVTIETLTSSTAAD